MSTIKEIYINSDNPIDVIEVTNETTGEYINNATVTTSLVDKATGIEVASVALSYISGSDGSYRGIIPDDTVLTAFQKLIAKVSIDGGAGLQKYYEVDCVAVVDKK